MPATQGGGKELVDLLKLRFFTARLPQKVQKSSPTPISVSQAPACGGAGGVAPG